MAQEVKKLENKTFERKRTEKALQESEEKLKAITASAKDAIIMMDYRGDITFWNKAAENMFGYSVKEAIGKEMHVFLAPQKYHDVYKKGIRKFKTTGQGIAVGKTLELEAKRKDGTIFPISLSVSAVKIDNKWHATGIVRDITRRKEAEEALKKAHDELERRVKERTCELAARNRQLRLEITDRKQTEEALRKSQKELKILSAQLLVAQEKERKRVAHELHDSIGQALTAIKFRVENTVGQLDKTRDTAVIESLKTVVPVVQYATEEVRRIAMGLRPSTLDDLGLLATIAWFCREFQYIYSTINIEKHFDIEENEVPEHLKTVIYRILQESLNNVAKHSNADIVRLSLRKKDNTMELVIKDNGIGFDLDGTLSPEGSGKGFGFSSMKKRTEISGGCFSIESSRRGGTLICAYWPADEM